MAWLLLQHLFLHFLSQWFSYIETRTLCWPVFQNLNNFIQKKPFCCMWYMKHRGTPTCRKNSPSSRRLLPSIFTNFLQRLLLLQIHTIKCPPLNVIVFVVQLSGASLSCSFLVHLILFISLWFSYIFFCIRIVRMLIWG